MDHHRNAGHLTRKFFGDLLGWTYPDQDAFPGYTFVDTGVPGALYTARGVTGWSG